MNVVFVHGILDNGSIFNKMIAHFEQQGVRCYAPSLTPSDGRTGLDELAIQLQGLLENTLTAEHPISIVGFSMGAIITRYYLQKLGGFRTTRQFFSISAPHKGSVWSYCYPGKGAKQLRPSSSFLQELEKSENCLQKMEIYSYWTPFDLVILPPRSSIWSVAHNIKINAWCHPCMLSKQSLISDVYRRLRHQS
jgi:triacylglycerol lipase